MKKLKIRLIYAWFINGFIMPNKVETSIEYLDLVVPTLLF
jgi:hypothetical protein